MAVAPCPWAIWPTPAAPFLRPFYVIGMGAGKPVLSWGDAATAANREDTMGVGFYRRILVTAGIVAVAGSAVAQQPPTRIRGEIEKVDGNTLTVKGRDGSAYTVNMA